MYMEIIFEAVILLVMVAAAHILGWKSVKLEEAPVREDENFLIAPPRRKAGHTKHARELRGKFSRRNRNAAVQSETIIVLPAVSRNWLIGLIVGAVMGILFTRNHFYGIAQTMVAPADHDMFYDYWFALMGIWFVAFVIAAWVAEWVVPNAAKARALKAGEARLKKGRTARFAQELSLDEIAIAARWYVAEQSEERKQRAATRRSQKQLRAELIQFPNKQLPMAANGR